MDYLAHPAHMDGLEKEAKKVKMFFIYKYIDRLDYIYYLVLTCDSLGTIKSCIFLVRDKLLIP